jgi:hypothetical protein
MLRSLVALVCSASLLLPGVAIAGPGNGPNMKAVETGFAAGSEQFEQGQFIPAVRTWTIAADLLPETAEHRPNRTALYERIAEAYERELDRLVAEPDAQEKVAVEAKAALDAYADKYTAAYPGEPLPASVERLRESAGKLVADAEARREAAKPPPEPDKPPEVAKPPPPPPPKPWKPLAIGGAIALVGGVSMLAMFGAGAARANKFEDEFDDPMNACDLDDPNDECAAIDKKGRTSNGLATAGLITGPLLLGAGVALLVIAARRKKAGNRTVAPLWTPTMAGVVFEQRF